MNDTSDFENADERPSRSQKRRDALALLALAEQLVELSATRLAKLGLPDDVREEITFVRGITSHGARKRQMAHLAKLMRRHDDEAFATARATLGEDRQHQQREAAAFQRVEALRDQLLDGNADALTAFIATHPDVDRQHLNALIRQARSERERNKPARAARELFRLLRDQPEA
ncbi:MAG TPA: ribosome biogenesis factor YjgA [Rhodanobacteraceae bacterium]